MECSLSKNEKPLIGSNLKEQGKSTLNRCKKCMALFYSLDVHMNLSHGNQSAEQCQNCGQWFLKKRLFKDHSRSCIGKHVCYICHKEKNSWKKLQKHLKSHIEVLLYSCPFCQYTFSSDVELGEHIKSHEVEEEIIRTCFICGKVTDAADNLHAHWKVEHAGILQCSCCPKRSPFSDFTSLFSHMLIMRNFRPFTCGECNSSYPCQAYLNRHIREAHDNENAHVCSVCGQGFNAAVHLKRHMANHDETLKHVCEFCSKQFIYKKNLVIHLKKNTCLICFKKLLCQSKLLKHQKNKHSREFICFYCGKSFDSSVTLNTHLSKYHYDEAVVDNKNSISCTECSLHLTSMHNFRRHLRHYNCNGKPSKFKRWSNLYKSK